MQRSCGQILRPSTTPLHYTTPLLTPLHYKPNTIPLLYTTTLYHYTTAPVGTTHQHGVSSGAARLKGLCVLRCPARQPLHLEGLVVVRGQVVSSEE